MLFTVASEANSFAAISALDRPGGRRLRERQIDLLCASPAMAATVLAVAPNESLFVSRCSVGPFRGV
jgi:hypothetical protein